MSDQTTTNASTGSAAGSTAPNAGAGQDGGQQNDAQPAGQSKQAFRTFASQDELDDFVSDRARRAERSALNREAKELGFANWQELSTKLGAQRQGAEGKPNQQPDKQQPAQTGPSEVERLRMALNVGQKLNLPAALVGRLQGTTLEEMEADAQALMGLFTAGQARAPGILPAPQTNQPATFTRQQLQDPEFVRKNKDAILEASRQGRIVNS